MKLTGKRIIVTGAASGIGQQSAKIMQERGATIIGFDRNQPKSHVDEHIPVDGGMNAHVMQQLHSF